MFEFERATSIPALRTAWNKVNANNPRGWGVDEIDLGYYRLNAEENIRILHYSLVSDSYEPCHEKSFVSRKNRIIYISCLEDKIVQSAIAKVVYESIAINVAVHGFVKNRSVFTARAALKKSMKNNITDYYKADISKFYESVNIQEILWRLSLLIGDARFLRLIRKTLYSHTPGLSTGSALSPVLSNMYLSDFDSSRQANTGFYSRYVDDMLLAPPKGASMDALIDGTSGELAKIGLSLNEGKSKIVSAEHGFTYLGFDIKTKNKLVDSLILQGDFVAADKILNTPAEPLEPAHPVDTPRQEETETRPETIVKEEVSGKKDESADTPVHVLAIAKKCHMVRQFVNKAKQEKYLSYPEKQTLLHIFHCLGEEGQKYLHFVLSCCDDYNYAVTQGHIDRCPAFNPLGCKKLCERFEDTCDRSNCNCNFKNDKLYPTPVIHALRRKPDCMTLQAKGDSIGHFKQLPAKQGAADALSRMLELNKKEYEIKSQRNIVSGQLESLFKRGNITEIQTPQGLLIKNNDGFFIKVG
jgi:hypothetical protein